MNAEQLAAWSVEMAKVAVDKTDWQKHMATAATLRSQAAELIRLQAAHDHQHAVAGTMLREAERVGRENDVLRKEVENERMRLAACGVVALADTPESAAKAREMHPDYRSPSCDAVARRVDECMRLRKELQPNLLKERAQLEQEWCDLRAMQRQCQAALAPQPDPPGGELVRVSDYSCATCGCVDLVRNDAQPVAVQPEEKP